MCEAHLGPPLKVWRWPIIKYRAICVCFARDGKNELASSGVVHRCERKPDQVIPVRDRHLFVWNPLR
jgi:hypothetical protein